MSLRGKISKQIGSFQRAVRSVSKQGMVSSNGALVGTSKISGYVCEIHEDDDEDESLRGTVDVQEYGVEYDDSGSGLHEGVLISAIQSGGGFKIVPKLFSDVVITQDPSTLQEYVVMFSDVDIFQFKAHEGVVVGVVETEDFVEGDTETPDVYELPETGLSSLTEYTADFKIDTVSDNEGQSKVSQTVNEWKAEVGQGSISLDDTALCLNGDTDYAVLFNKLSSFMQELLNLIASGQCTSGAPLSTAPQIAAMASKIVEMKSSTVRLGG